MCEYQVIANAWMLQGAGTVDLTAALMVKVNELKTYVTQNNHTYFKNHTTHKMVNTKTTIIIDSGRQMQWYCSLSDIGEGQDLGPELRNTHTLTSWGKKQMFMEQLLTRK